MKARGLWVPKTEAPRTVPGFLGQVLSPPPASNDADGAEGQDWFTKQKRNRAVYTRGVSNSLELRRIYDLPRRTLDLSLDLTDEFRTPHGSMRLRPIQSAALHEARTAQGLLANIGTGFGKTLISLLIPAAVNSKCALIVIPASLRHQLINVLLPEYLKHWRIPREVIHVVSYEDLSVPKGTEILSRLLPTDFIGDEIHKIASRNSVRGRRFRAFFKAFPNTRLYCMSGSLTARSVMDYAHLSQWALKDHTPLPRGYYELQEWSAALDAEEDPAPPGALTRFCAPGESVRAGFRRRLVETPGVVCTEEAAVGASLYLYGRTPTVPLEVKKALQNLERTWELPGGEFLTDGLAYARAARQLASGFYYRWVWPNNTPDQEWLDARREWHREIREFLKRHTIPGMDSPMFLARAADTGKWKSKCWAAWKAVKDRPEPPVETVWVSDFLLQDVANHTAKLPSPPIIFYEFSAFGEALAKGTGYKHFGAGPKASRDLINLAESNTPPEPIVCSIHAHGTGKNLQTKWSCLTLPSSPTNASLWEQAISRVLRPGQKAEEVSVYVYRHTKEMVASFDKAVREATYQQETMGQPQKILYAGRDF
jgi:hypothetical protein